MTAALPDGFRIRVADGVRCRDHGTMLVGGTPPRVVRLSMQARTLFDDGTVVVTGPTSRRLADRLLAADLAVPVFPGNTPGLGDVTVVVPVRNRTDGVERLLTLLGPYLRCLVVDDASQDGPRLARVVRGHDAEYVRLETNVGPAGARNAGLARVTTEYVAFVDSDVTVAAEDLLRLRQHFADPQVAAVAPRVRGRSTTQPPRWFERYDADRSSLDLGNRSSLVRPGGKVAYVPTACLIARTACLGGGFDRSMRVGEDVDLIWRLVKQGWRVRLEASIVASHDTPPTACAWLLRKVSYGSSAAALAERHGKAVAPAVFTIAGAVNMLAVLSPSRWSALGATTALGHSAFRLARTLPRTPSRPRLVAELTVEGVVTATLQGSSLLLRHWAPVTLPTALLFRRTRFAVAASLVVDLLVHSAGRPRTLRPSQMLARRLDDVAYGVGVWLGAARVRSAGCLRPRLVVTRAIRAARSPRQRSRATSAPTVMQERRHEHRVRADPVTEVPDDSAAEDVVAVPLGRRTD